MTALRTYPLWQRPLVMLAIVVAFPFVLMNVAYTSARRRIRAAAIVHTRLRRHGRN